MTFKLLCKIIKKYELPDDILLLSDSGWECDETHMNGIWYNKNKNEIIITQGFLPEYDKYAKMPEWELLYCKETHKEEYQRKTHV